MNLNSTPVFRTGLGREGVRFAMEDMTHWTWILGEGRSPSSNPRLEDGRDDPGLVLMGERRGLHIWWKPPNLSRYGWGDPILGTP